MQNYKNYFEIPTPSYGGLNTALQFSLIPREQSPSLQNAYMDEEGDISQRPGSAPVIATALGNPILHLTTFPFKQTVAVGAAPTLSVVAGVAALPAATYYVRYTYVTENGETEASAEASQAIVLGETLRIAIPAIPFHANSINIYISTATNSETLRFNVTALTKDVAEPLPTAGVAYPTANTTEFRGEILASSGTSLHSLYNGSFHAATMTNPLESADIYDADFTGVSSTGGLVDVKIIGDGGTLKKYNGGAVVEITPATDDTSPLPANVLADINLKGVKYVWEHKGHVFCSPGTNEVFFSKRAGESGNGNQYDYWQETNFQLLVRKGDYVNGCGVSFDDRMMIPMRHGWNTWTGENFDTFDSSGYLNTINGVIAPRSIDRLTYPGGLQTIGYLSDDGVHEIFTSTIDTQGRQYATRSLMDKKLDWHAYGFTDEEMSEAVSQYIVQYNMYLLEISHTATVDGSPVTTRYVFGFDTRNTQWYVWHNLTINTFLETEGVVYFAGIDGFLKKFDKDYYGDYTNFSRTTGPAVHFKRYSPAVSSEFSGFASMWDAYLVESKQWLVPATLDITFIFANNTDVMERIIRNEIFIEGVSRWGESKYANLNFTDLVNEPNEILFDYSRLSKYVQVLWENNRYEPVKVYKEIWKGRSSGK